MKVEDVKGKAVLTLTHEELGIVRYALNEGTEKLESTARYMHRMATLTGTGKGVARSAKQTASRARRANDALEAASQVWACEPTRKL